VEIGIIKSDSNTLKVSQIFATITYSKRSQIGPSGPTKVLFSGNTYSSSTIEITRKSILDEVYKNIGERKIIIDNDGSFVIEILGLLKGEYFFSLKAVDERGDKSSALSFGVNLISFDNFSAKNILFPPTIRLSETLVSAKDSLEITGYSSPNRVVEIKFDENIVGETLSDDSGYYSYSMNMSKIAAGEHYVRSREAVNDDKKSNFSVFKALKLTVPAFSRADFNDDYIVNVSDWSIFLSRQMNLSFYLLGQRFWRFFPFLRFPRRGGIFPAPCLRRMALNGRS